MTNLTNSRSEDQPPNHFTIEATVDRKRTRWRPQEGAKCVGPRVQQIIVAINNEEQSKRPRVLDVQGCFTIKIKSRLKKNRCQKKSISSAPHKLGETKNKEERHRESRGHQRMQKKNAQRSTLHCKGVLDLAKSLRTVQPTSRQAGKNVFIFKCLHCFLVYKSLALKCLTHKLLIT